MRSHFRLGIDAGGTFTDFVFADKSGMLKDSTLSIQHAVDFARWHYLAVFLPHGTYRISDTIIARQTTRMMLTGDIPGEKGQGFSFTRDFLLDGVECPSSSLSFCIVD